MTLNKLIRCHELDNCHEVDNNNIVLILNVYVTNFWTITMAYTNYNVNKQNKRKRYVTNTRVYRRKSLTWPRGQIL